MFSLTENPALAALGGVTTGRGADSTMRQAGTPPTRSPSARTVNDGTPAPRSEATGATERRFAAASHKGVPHTSHAPPAPSERVLTGSHRIAWRCLPATAHSN